MSSNMTDEASGLQSLESEKNIKPISGILRLDIRKANRATGSASVEFRSSPEWLGDAERPNSPQPSVKWASPPDDIITDDPNERHSSDIGPGDNDCLKPDTTYRRHSSRSSAKNYVKSPRPPGDQTAKRNFRLGALSPSTGIIASGPHRRNDETSAFSPITPFGVHHRRQNSSISSSITFAPEEPSTIGDSEDEDYSISVSAVMQRRASTKGHRKRGAVAVGGGYISPRRASSPMGHVTGIGVGGGGGGGIVLGAVPSGGGAVVGSVAGSVVMSAANSFDRRRSSVFTSSSAETAISFGDGTHQESTKEQIFENIRLHKEVLQSVKLQPWSMRRKLRLVRQAKEYVARHEGALQERFAMSRSTKDLWARFKILMAARWQHFKREVANVSTVIVPWELRIKEIESHFGSVVASYFTFLRWLLWVNIVIAFALTVFVVMPEFMGTQWPPQKPDHRKIMLKEELANATRLHSVWDFEGFLKYSPLFYGYYSNFSGASRWSYNLPLAYFLTGLAVYIYSFWATLRKMAENSRSSKLSSKDDECVFSWKLFTGWDYMIGHAETAHNRIASVVLGFKEALLEEAEKKKDTRNWKIIVLRGLVNLMVLFLLGVSAFAVVWVVNRSTELGPNDSYLRSNEIPIVITAISLVFPMLFEALGLFESYHPRKQLRMQLARIMALNLLNLYALIFALFNKINTMNTKLMSMKYNITRKWNLHESQIKSTTTEIPLMFAPSNIRMRDTIFEEDATEVADAMAVINSTASSISNEILSMTTTSEFESSGETVTAMLDNLSQKHSQCRLVPVACSKPNNVKSSALVTSFLLLNIINATTVPTFLFNDTSTVSSTISTDIFDEVVSDRENTTNVFSTTESSSTELDSFGFYNRDIPFANMTNATRHKRETDLDYSDYYDDIPEDTESFSTSTVTTTLSDQDEDFNNSSMLYNSTIDLIYSTMATHLDNITTEMTFETSTEYMDFATTTLLDFITTQFPELHSETHTCFKNVCVEFPTQDTTTTFDEMVQSTTNEIHSTSESPTTTGDAEETTTTAYTLNGFVECSTPLPTESWTTDSSSSSDYPTETTSTQKSYDHESLEQFIGHMDPAKQLELRKMCWETMFGQELVKLNVMDLVAIVSSALFSDFFRALFVRYFNNCWCWNLEKRFPKYGDFKIAENILHLVNNQGLVWMGMFFSPGLAILNLIKLVIIMYLRSWAVLTCNVPHEVVFRASRSNNFYLALLLTMLFLCVLPVGYAIVWLNPSWHCGPFSNYNRIYLIFTDTLRHNLPSPLPDHLDYIASPSTVIPLLLLLVLIIYYLVSLTGALREANQDLRIQLRRERTEGRKKMLKLPKADDTANGGTAIDRWRKVLEASSPVSPTGTGPPIEQDDIKNNARKELLARIMKKAMRKGSNTSDDESQLGGNGDETDTEQHESLPRDQDTVRPTIASLHRKTNRQRKSVDDTPNDLVPERNGASPNKLNNIIKLVAQKESKKSTTPESNQPIKPSSQVRNPVVQKDVKGNSPSSRFKVDQVNNSVENPTKTKKSLQKPPKNIDDDELYREKVVSERRQSILLRQKKLPPDLQVPLPPTQEQLNYKVVNEKNQAMEKRANMQKRRSTSEDQGDAFHFDRSDTTDLMSDDDNTSYRECDSRSASKMASCDDKPDAPTSELKSSATSANRRGSSPEYPKRTNCNVNVIPEEFTTKPVTNQKRRLNSFLALVKEVVYKKPECVTDGAPTGQPVDMTIPEESPSEPVMIQRRDSIGGRHSSLRRKSKVHVKRQDSQASIWSDNIPVITISKTASDECILENRPKAESERPAATGIETPHHDEERQSD